MNYELGDSRLRGNDVLQELGDSRLRGNDVRESFTC